MDFVSDPRYAVKYPFTTLETANLTADDEDTPQSHKVDLVRSSFFKTTLGWDFIYD